MNLSYFKNRDIVITLVCSIATGIIMMSNIFLPQFCENSMMIRSGSGGYSSSSWACSQEQAPHVG